MSELKGRSKTSSGFYVTEEAPIKTDNPVPTPKVGPPDILRCAYMEIIVTDLAKSRHFYVEVLGLTVTEEDDSAIYLRSLEEFIHHNLVLRKGPIAGVSAFSYRVRTPEDLDKAVAFYTELEGSREGGREGAAAAGGGGGSGSVGVVVPWHAVARERLAAAAADGDPLARRQTPTGPARRRTGGARPDPLAERARGYLMAKGLEDDPADDGR